MTDKRTMKCVVVALTVVFVMSAFVVMISPVARANFWTQTTDLDFNTAQTMSNVNIYGSGDVAYVQLDKTFYGWFNKNPANAPPQRQAAGSFFDSVNGRVLIFGGLDSSSQNLNDVWAYYSINNTWIKVSDSAPWTARWGHSAAFDSVQGIGVMYGGWDINGPSIETWEYAAATGVWTNRTGPLRPEQMSDYPMTFDSAQQKMILTGYGRSSWETWAYDATTHLWAMRTGSTPPQNRAGHKIAYFPGITKTVLYGGSMMFTTWDETWEYDWATDKWTNKTGQTGGDSPGGRSAFGMVYRSASGDLMLFGGQNGASFPTTTYRYWNDAGNRMWTLLVTGSNPPGRSDLVMSYDTATTASMVHAGRLSTGQRMNDTWLYDAGYQPQGSMKSAVFDSLHSLTSWHYITWNQTPANVPAGTTIRFQLATSQSADGPWNFYGPGGSGGAYYTTPGEAIWGGASPARYIVYFVQMLCISCLDTPRLEDVSIWHTWVSTPPSVASTYPFAQLGVPVNSQIWLNFSEPMDTAQVTVTLKDVPTWTDFPYTTNWFNGSTNLVLSHSTPFEFCTQYRYNITQAMDQEGQSMAGLPKSYVFSTFCPEPEILSVYPHLSDVDIPHTSAIYVNFSKSMNTGTVDVNMTPPLPDFNYVWTNGNKNLKVAHVADLGDCVDYTVNVTGLDINGKSLVPGAVPNPWYFESRCLNPRVSSTDPIDGAIEVAVDKAVKIVFSHKMQTSTVNVTFTPAITLTKSWNSPTNTTLTLNHPPAFTACTLYKANVTGKDTSGNSMQGGYYLFSFFTTCGGSPYVVSTQPQNGATNVALNFNVQFAFNEAMQRSTVTYTVVPSDWTWTIEWFAMDMIMIVNHTTDFSACTRYYVNITGGRDVDENKNIVPGPVPDHIYFDTVCQNPSIKSWVPPDGSIDVLNNTNIVITFNKAMNTGSFAYTLSPSISLNTAWSNGDTVFTLSHGPLFADCQNYSLRISIAESWDLFPLMGDRQLDFRTFCPGNNPWIELTDPAHRATDVPTDKLIFVKFSEPMDPATLGVIVVPNTPMAPVWTGGGRYLNLSHAPLLENTLYTITISACDIDGMCLVPGPVPNPWNFTTTAANPYIVSTDPANNQQDVSLTKSMVVVFVKPMNTGSVNWIVDPPGMSFSAGWTNLDKTLTLAHGTPFQACIQYTVTITGQDTGGKPLVAGPVPNPWVFTTTCLPGAPGGLKVARQGADITLTWRTATLAVGYHIFSATDRFAPWPWPVIGNVTGTTFTATGHNSDTVNHFYIVRGYSAAWLDGANSSMGVRMYRQFNFNALAVNNDWFSLPYRTMYLKASDIAKELTESKINVVAKWDPYKQTSILYYYFHNSWRGNDFTISRGDGLWLGVVSSFSWSINGTDVSQSLQFMLNSPPRGNYYFISLPYTNGYTNAQSISTELTSTKVVELGRWNPASKTWEKWTFSGGTWAGTNFAILPGEGFYMVIASGFTWSPKLITPDVP